MLVAFCALAEREILDNSSSAATGAKETRRERAMAARERTTALQSSVTASSVKDLERNDVTTREKKERKLNLRYVYYLVSCKKWKSNAPPRMLLTAAMSSMVDDDHRTDQGYIVCWNGERHTGAER